MHCQEEEEEEEEGGGGGGGGRRGRGRRRRRRKKKKKKRRRPAHCSGTGYEDGQYPFVLYNHAVLRHETKTKLLIFYL